ncbi:MAG: Wzz/FepE/Etk N-terminal domain-containing protein [Candidatus Eisenbacteria bacterium]
MDTQPRLKETVDLRSYTQLLWRRKWMVLLPTLIAGLAGIVFTMPRFMQPLYRCSATLSVELPTPLTRELSGMVANPSLMERLLRLESQVQSSEFLSKIIDNTGMREDVETLRWAQKNQKKYPDMTMDELVSLRLERYLRQAIRLKTADDGNQIQVSAVDTQSHRCYLLVRSLCSGIVEASRSVHLEVLRSTEDYSQAQLLEWKRQLDDARRSSRRSNGTVPTPAVTPGLVGDGTSPPRMNSAGSPRGTSGGSRVRRLPSRRASQGRLVSRPRPSTGSSSRNRSAGSRARAEARTRLRAPDPSRATGEAQPETIAIQVVGSSGSAGRGRGAGHRGSLRTEWGRPRTTSRPVSKRRLARTATTSSIRRSGSTRDGSLPRRRPRSRSSG